MKFLNVNCDGCHNKFENGDDVVVCPVCGTPQHRECYNEKGACVNEEKHESGFVWQMPEEIRTEKSEPIAVNPKEKPMPFADRNSIPTYEQIVETRIQALAPGITDEQRKELLCDHNISETVAFIGNNARGYVDKFRKMERLNKNSFNFGAFFFTPIWFFWRRLYKAGVVYMALMISVSMLITAPYEKYMTFLEGIISSGAQNFTEAQFEELTVLTMPLLAGAAAVFVIRFIAGITANRMYHRYCTKTLYEIDRIKGNCDDLDMLQFYLKRSSTGTFAASVASLVYYFLPSFLMSLFI